MKDIFFNAQHIQHPKKLHDNDLSFLLERMKIEKIGKLVANLHDKKEYLIYIRDLKQALNHGLVLKKVYKVIKFDQKAWLKSYIDMNTELRKKKRMILKIILLS